jgi:hypothetical protein
MNEIAGLLVVVSVFSTSALLNVLGYKLLMKSNREEKTIVRFGNFELTLSSVVGSILILAALSMVIYQINKFYS